MANSIYKINKGINKPIEFKGLKAQYIWFLAGGILLLMFLFAVLYISGVKLSELEQKLIQLATLIKTYRRISLTEIAKKFGLTEIKAEKLLDTAIELKLISGNMDRTTGEFFISESLNEIKKISFCPNCGASITQIVHQGETAKCSACGSFIN